MKYVVHGLEPMTVVELAGLACGHCHHRLSWHVTAPDGHTFCSACHCLRRPNEDILRPHNVQVDRP